MYSVKSHVKDREPTQELFSQEDSWVGCIFTGTSSQWSQSEWSEGPVGCPGAWSPQGEREGVERQEKEDKDEKTKRGDEGRGPPGGPVNGKEKTVIFLQHLKPRTRNVIEQPTWLPHGCSCSYFGLRMGTTLEWLSRRRCLSWWAPFTPSWKVSALESPRIPLSRVMQPHVCN